jgi:hypothetical protein
MYIGVPSTGIHPQDSGRVHPSRVLRFPWRCLIILHGVGDGIQVSHFEEESLIPVRVRGVDIFNGHQLFAIHTDFGCGFIYDLTSSSAMLLWARAAVSAGSKHHP